MLIVKRLAERIRSDNAENFFEGLELAITTGATGFMGMV